MTAKPHALAENNTARRSNEQRGRTTQEILSRLAEQNNLVALGALAADIGRHPAGLAVRFVPTRHLIALPQDIGQQALVGYWTEEGEDTRGLASVDEAIQHEWVPPSEVRVIAAPDIPLPLSAALDMLARLRMAAPDAWIRGFSAVDIWRWQYGEHVARATILAELRGAGLNALGGGGALALTQPDRTPIDADTWLAIHREAHLAGLASTAAFWCDDGATDEVRFAALRNLRNLQQETMGFRDCVPVAWHHPQSGAVAPGALLQICKWTALARILLDNVRYIRYGWDQTPLRRSDPQSSLSDAGIVATMQMVLGFGADALDGLLATDELGGLTEDVVRRTITSTGRIVSRS